MDNAGWQKTLKLLSIIYMVIDVAFIVVLALGAAAVFSPETTLLIMGVDDASVFGDADVMSAVTLLSVSAIVAYVINLICTIFAYRGAKNPAKMKPGMVLYGILSVFSVFGLISNLVGGTLTGVTVGTYIMVWFMFYCTLRVNKMAK